MKKIKVFVCLLAVLTLICACEGPEGPEGPTGSTGTKGDKGDQGTKGNPGDKGADGNANVKSHEYSVLTTDWTYASTIGRYYYTFSSTIVTSDIAANGFVKVFYSVNETNWLNLPFTYFYTDYFSVYNYMYGDGYVEVYIDASNLTPKSPTATTYFMVIAVAGTAVALNPQIKNYSFNEFKNSYPEIGKSVILK
jgi:hypothetical protein